jgi:monofunctional biosynthetic peptidoglycan transglycosylase
MARMRAWLADVARPARVAARFVRAVIVLVAACHAVLFAFVFLASLVLLAWNPPITALMIYRGVTVHQKSKPVRFVPLHQIPRVARNMVIRLEDHHFYSHRGVDLGAIRDAWMINASIGRTAVGGSTIPMQLARNLFLTPRKTYLRKYIEALIAVEMSLILPKDRILELYLNEIEWGKGIFGIGAASAYYFKTGVGGLGLDELRRLATIITNPLRYDVSTFSRSAQMSQRYAYLLSRFPDPSAEPGDHEGAVAPVPDAPQPPPASPPPPSVPPNAGPSSP